MYDKKVWENAVCMFFEEGMPLVVDDGTVGNWEVQ